MKKALIAASVMTTVALGSTAALVAANAADQAVKPAVVSPVVANHTVAENDSLLLHYVKKSIYAANGDLLGYEETWGDPLTYNQRTDAHFAGEEMSFYSLHNGTTSAKVAWDAQGNVEDGIVVTVAPEDSAPSGPLYELMEKQYQTEEWKNADTVTVDGKKLKKVILTYESNEGTSPSNMYKVKSTETAYLDAQTGLPVKSEIHEEKDGKMVLYSSFVYEYDRKDRDHALFDISGLDLEDYTSEEVKANYPYLPIGGKVPNPLGDLVSEGEITEAQQDAIYIALSQAKQKSIENGLDKSNEAYLKAALAGIVVDGTITQEQADIIVNIFK
ncbi:hypothetical protein OIN60_10550 [Paenibacillus sp. P96]|uniref:Copper amine oxidase-like N-terminal domain-containing protein n=1 Tax=Paenibacillus zeirhizosphaerae TaxID=2987519 RepID=A0ABT9FRB4_9BACL|nr:hypothetical protein [Paenibacillus sp. P96]MDP4097209.1 hypothetical protein [Paenibacillus sp. P96]